MESPKHPEQENQQETNLVSCQTCFNPGPSDMEQTDGQLCCQFKYQIVLSRPVSDYKELTATTVI